MNNNSCHLRRIVAAVLCVIAVATASASVKYLIVNRSDGSMAAFALADYPVVKNTVSELIVESTGSTIAVPFSSLENFSFSETGLAGLDKEVAETPSHTYSDGQITFTGLKADSKISVYSIDGHQVINSNANSEGYASINLSGLGTGIYVVTAGNSSFKFIVK